MYTAMGDRNIIAKKITLQMVPIEANLPFKRIIRVKYVKFIKIDYFHLTLTLAKIYHFVIFLYI